MTKNRELIASNKAQIERVETVVSLQIENLNENIKKLETAVHELTAELKAQQNTRR
jgi:tetrahydromethanopterin S-methyltransferase subunit B